MVEGVIRTFSVRNFGCRATQADGAGIASSLHASGLREAGTGQDADVVVVNTCTVTAEADRGARKALRRVHRENPDAEILVTGCYAQRSPAELASFPGVKWVVGNSHKHEIAQLVAPRLVQIGNARHTETYHGGVEAGGTLVGDISAQAVLHALPVGVQSGRSRPNVKVQDGCNNRCSFCIIPSVRGRSRSASADAVAREVAGLEGEFPEIVLTGINLGRWGRDLEGRPRLPHLLRTLLRETRVEKIRLSSVEPMDWTSDLLGLMASSPRIAEHVHIPLQSASDEVLKRMRRRYRVRHYESRLKLARSLMPWAAIGADVMVGFPGESEACFEETRVFVERMPFTYLHVFPYSAREGTGAARLGDQVPKRTKRRRSRVLRELVASKNLQFRQGLVGEVLDAVSLSAGTRGTRVLTDNYMEVDLPGQQLRPRSSLRVVVQRVGTQGTVGRPLT